MVLFRQVSADCSTTCWMFAFIIIQIDIIPAVINVRNTRKCISNALRPQPGAGDILSREWRVSSKPSHLIWHQGHTRVYFVYHLFRPLLFCLLLINRGGSVSSTTGHFYSTVAFPKNNGTLPVNQGLNYQFDNFVHCFRGCSTWRCMARPYLCIPLYSECCLTCPIPTVRKLVAMPPATQPEVNSNQMTTSACWAMTRQSREIRRDMAWSATAVATSLLQSPSTWWPTGELAPPGLAS